MGGTTTFTQEARLDVAVCEQRLRDAIDAARRVQIEHGVRVGDEPDWAFSTALDRVERAARALVEARRRAGTTGD